MKPRGKPRMSFKPRLKLSSPSFKLKDLDAEAAKLFDQTAKQNYANFIRHPQSKTFTDFQNFIEFIPLQDFDWLQNKQRREAVNFHKGEQRTKIHPALVQSFYIKQNAKNQLESRASNENFMAEIAGNSFQVLEKMGKCLSGLYVEKILQGSNGRYLLYMVDCRDDLDEIEEKYKHHSFEIDDQVAFCYIEYSPYISAVGNVYQKLSHGLVISIDGSQINEAIYSRFRADQSFSLVKQEYHAVFEVNNQTLRKLLHITQPQGYLPHPFILPTHQILPEPCCAPLLKDLLRDTFDDKENEAIHEDIEFLDKGLNEDQQKAVKAALSVKNIYLIDGPAGTGKTRVLAEVIHQCVKKGLKVLACGPSVFAVDNLIGRMLDKNIKACRIGRSGNPDENIDRFSIDSLLKKNKRIKMIQDECDSLLEFFKITEDKHFLERTEANAEIARKYQTGVRKVIVDSSDVVFSTLQGASASVLEQNNFSFDVAIIDECSQATEIAAWTAILKTKKLIIAGDRLQLPPFIINEEAKELGLNFTLFDRLKKRLTRNLIQVLRIQYRMNEKIMAWSNEQFYKGKLIANDTCAQYTLQEYLKKDSQIKEDKVPILILIDTKNSGYVEKRGISYSNIGEAAVVLELLEYLLANYNLKKEEIGVISPYQDQHELITRAIECKSDLRGIKCQTVDYFQGKEKEVIILSLVRSNEYKIVGFLDDSRRMNVAVTRAKRFVAIVCDTSTISQPELPFLVKLIDHFKSQGQVLTPDDFKGVGYQIRFLRSVLNGEIEPALGRKSQAKVMKNIDAMNQALKIEEEEKIQSERKEKKTPKLLRNFQMNQNINCFVARNPVMNQNMMVNPMMNPPLMYPPIVPVNTFMMPFPLYPNPTEVGNHQTCENKRRVGMNYSDSELQDELEDKSLVGNECIFVKNESKDKKKKKHTGGFQIKQEDFPELGRGV